nr:unnamed protein product [Callosobruchus analis]
MLNRKTKVLLTGSLVLSYFNFCDVVYDACIDQADVKRIQKVQNSCLRLIYGIRRGHHISHKLKETNWLSMANRRKLHSACTYHNILTTKEPSCLYNKVLFRCEVHNVNIRSRAAITYPAHRTSLFKRSFSYNIAKIYNSLPSQLKTLSAKQFKKRYSSILKA